MCNLLFLKKQRAIVVDNIMLKKTLKQFITAIKEVVFPSKCLSCKTVSPGTASQNKKKITFETLMEPHLCRNCISKLTQVTSPICSCCGMMFKERVSDDHLCGNCIKKKPVLRIARSFGVYDQTLLDIIRAYKFRNKLQLAKPLGTILYNLYKNNYWDSTKDRWHHNSPDLIIPVPLHKSRFRKRKFNQAWLLIKNWDTQKTNCKILSRKRSTKPQTGLDKKTRKKNIQGAFYVNTTEKVKGKKILIIDDVYTTGATANECAKELLKNGAQHVDVLTIARTQAV